MVRQYYVPQITELSEQELQEVFEKVEPPVCLLGGWAVHFHVNPGFQSEHGRDYIGSRDIDIGIHVNDGLGGEELLETPVGKSISALEGLGYTKSRFGFVQNFLRDSQERITEDEANRYGMHEVFQVYVDLIPDTRELEDFRRVFGFTPPAEPLLAPVFEHGIGEPISEYVSWSHSADKMIAPAKLLAAMKIRSLPDRDKSHKQVKDVADLHSLLWYVKDFGKMKADTKGYVSGSKLDRVDKTVDEAIIEDTAQLLQVDERLISNSISRLVS